MGNIEKKLLCEMGLGVVTEWGFALNMDKMDTEASNRVELDQIYLKGNCKDSLDS